MVWKQCLQFLKNDHDFNDEEMNMWLHPLQSEIKDKTMILYAPNNYVVNWINNNCLSLIKDYVTENSDNIEHISLKVGSPGQHHTEPADHDASVLLEGTQAEECRAPEYNDTIVKNLTFDNYIEGKCNVMARASAIQVIHYIQTHQESPFNPFLIYGGTGLGKTHLMHAIGNKILENNHKAKVVYITATKFVREMVSAFQNNTPEKFKSYYNSVDVLLVDDIQFFAGKERSQVEFFHTFNNLLEDQKQIIMTCDVFPKEVDGIEDRLKSRFGWGLSVGIQMPDVETRIAILISKARELNFDLPEDVAFFIAEHIRSNIRELEGALRSVIAASRITGNMSKEFAASILHDVIHVHNKKLSLENIQKKVCEYYNIKVSDLQSKKRSRNISRPRQLAMYLSKELTQHSLPDIGNFYGGRDHTTVLHACKTIKKLIDEDTGIKEDYTNLSNTLNS